MNLIDWLLNVAAIFLWMEWRSARSSRPQSALSIASAVRPAGRGATPGMGSGIGLAALLVVRPIFYFTIGSAVNWIPSLDFLSISIPWRSDLLGRMYLFSMLTFGKAIGFYYSWMLLLGAVNDRLADENLMQRFVRGQLGWLEKIPWWLKLLLPAVVAGAAWHGLAFLFTALDLMPPGAPAQAVWYQSGAFALASVLAWKWLLIACFMVYFLNTYVFLGAHALWVYIGLTARRLLRPISFLRIGALDLAPVAGAIIVFSIAQWVIRPAALELFESHLR
jgi:hypothetical protein